MSDSTILIVDRKSDRAQAMASSFPQSMRVIETWKDGVEGHVRVSDDGILPSECLVCLWHLGDYVEADPAWLAVRAKLIVFYGGDGGRDSRCPIDAEIVWRPIVRKEEALTPEEAAQLIAYANDRTQRPEFLQEPQATETLASLAILCQGYMAVFAASGQPQCPETARVLSLMGWDSAKHRELVRGNLQEVQNPHWWLDALGIPMDTHAVSGAPMKESAWRELSNTLTLEWGQEGKTFLALPFFDNLRRSRPLNDARMVAEAYVKIAARLRLGKP